MLHYNFPPFSVGETQAAARPRPARDRPRRARRARARAACCPTEETFPYTIRIVSDILESNGSSSMASVCGGSLAMMDAGVPLKAPVAGIAMGLIMDEETGKYAVLTDIAGRRGPLRRHGLQGRRHRRRASPRCRWTSRSPGITARDHARGAATRRATAACTSSARWPRRSPAPRDEHLARTRRASSRIKIPPDKIRDVIGPGGKMIRSIIERRPA